MGEFYKRNPCIFQYESPMVNARNTESRSYPGVRERIPYPSLFRTSRYGLGTDGKRIDSSIGVRVRNGKRVTFKDNGNDVT